MIHIKKLSCPPSSNSSSSISLSLPSSSSTSYRKKPKRKKKSSTSEDSEADLRKELKKLRKKGKLKSGRVRSGLPVVRDQDWPHESINVVLAGRKFEANNLTENSFVAGILNSISQSEEFKKLKKGG